MAAHKQLYHLFAEILEYPSPTFKDQANGAAECLAQCCPQAGERFSEFHAWVRQARLTLMQEIYTSTFDLQGICCPYVGHHLFGDSYQRNWFMAQLNGGYHARGYSSGTELPDHVAVILRFLGQAEEDEFSQVLVEEGLIPCLEKMIQSFDGTHHHPYGQLLKSLWIVLQNGMTVKESEWSNIAAGGVGDD